MTDVFISYSRRDKVFTQKLVDALQAANREVWADWNSIPAASDWDAEIKEGIEKTNTVLFLLSPEWIKSNECRKEMIHAIQHGKRLVPILYLMPDQGQEVPPELAKINWVYMRDTDNFDKAFETLQSAMDTDLDWIKTHTRVQVRAIEWDKKKRDNSFTLRGKDLTDGEQFISGATGKSPEPTQLQGEYVLASRKDATRRQRITLAGVTIALVVSVVLGITAYFQRQAAILNGQISFARELTAQSENNLDKDPERSILLALQAIRTLEDVNQPILTSTSDALRKSIQASRIRFSIQSSDSPVRSVVFSPDGKYILSGGDDGVAHVWNVYTGQEVAHMTHQSRVNVVAFTPDGKYAVSGGLDYYLKVWEPSTSKEITTIDHKGEIEALNFSTDGKYLAVASKNKIIRIWKTSDWKEFSSIQLDNQPTAVTFSPDGKWIATAETMITKEGLPNGAIVKLWDQNGSLISSTDGTGICAPVKRLTFSNNANNLAVTSQCYTPIEHIATATMTITSSYPTIGDGVVLSDSAVSPDGELLAGSDLNFSVTVVDSLKFSIKYKLLDNSEVFSLAFSPDGKYVVTGNKQGQVKIWNALIAGYDEIGIADMRESGNGVYGLDFNPDGTMLAALSWPANKAYLWSLNGGKNKQLVSFGPYINDIAFSPDGKKVVTGSGGCNWEVWDLEAKNAIGALQFNSCGDIVRVAFSSDGKLIAGATIPNRTTAIVDIEAKKLISVQNAFGVEFNSQGNGILLQADDGVYERAILDGENKVEFVDGSTNGGSYAESINNPCPSSYSPDYKYVLSCPNQTAILWDAVTGKQVRTFFGHTAAIETATFNPDGSLLATASKDGTVKIWDVTTGENIGTISPLAGPVHNVKFSPDGKNIVLGAEDGVARFYLVGLGNLRALATTRITRSFSAEECQTFLHQDTCPENIPQEKPQLKNALDVQISSSFSEDEKIISKFEDYMTISQAAESNLVYQDDFETNQSKMTTFQNEVGSAAISDGVYSVTALVSNTFVNDLSPFVMNDGVIAVDVKINSTSPDNVANVWCRYNDDNGGGFKGYVFSINGSGQVALIISENTRVTPLVDFTPTAATFNQVGYNTLSVSCVGDQLKLSVNNEVVIDVTDNTFISGQFALGAFSFNDASVTRVDFDNMVIRKPENGNSSTNTDTVAIVATSTPIPTQAAGTQATEGLKSGNGTVETALNLSNNSGYTLKLNWVDFEGIEQAFSDLTNGEVTISTFNTHVWRIRDLNGNLIFEYIATEQPIQEIIINTDLTVTVK